MADATEDTLFATGASGQPSRSNNGAAPGADSDNDDDDDLLPNFLALGRSSMARDGPVAAGIPKRGTKDFEANRTLLQSRALAASRDAMWDALGVVRVHHGGAVVAPPPPRRRSSKKDKGRSEEEVDGPLEMMSGTAGKGHPGAADVTVEEQTVSPVAHGGTPLGIYDRATGVTTVPREHVRGGMFMRLGRDLSGGGVALLPEEALWALEGNKLDVRYPADFWPVDAAEDDEDDGDYDDEDDKRSVTTLGGHNASDSMPMSLQGAHAAYIGEESLRGGRLTIEKYLVYAALKRLGFIVLRSPEWVGGASWGRATESAATPEKRAQTLSQWLLGLLSVAFTPRPESGASRDARQRLGPLVAPGIHRSYPDIYRMLALIPAHDPLVADKSEGPSTASDSSSQDPVFTTHWDVYKPPGATAWRKSAPGAPSFRVCVVSARDTAVPSLAQLDALMREQRLEPLADNPDKKDVPGRPKHPTIGGTYARLKHGHRNVIVAVVDEGLVSYMRLADAAFSREPLYGWIDGARGGKGGGRGGGRGGRGRGRGRGGRGRG